MFIVIEGGDASGKTSLIKKMQSIIKHTAIPFNKDEVVFFKSPTDPFADLWKIIISHKNMTPLTRFKLFHTIAYNDSEAAKAAIRSRKHVILERYLQSTEAFNYTLDNFNSVLDPDLRSENHISYKGLLKPDIGFLLDVSNDNRIKRMEERFKNGNNSPWEHSEFQIPLNEKLREIANRDKFITVDTNVLSKKQTAELVISKILEFSKLRG